MSDTASSPSLVEKPIERMDRPQPVIVRVAKEHGVSPFAQLVETTKLRFGASKLASNEYYDMGLFRPALSASEKRAFVGETRNEALNRSLSPRAVATQNDLVENKLGFGALLAKHGLGAPETQAVFAVQRDFEGFKPLRTENEILAFLTQQAKFPLFGKPVNGSKSVGSALFSDIDASADTLTLGTGRVVPLAATVKEMTQKFGSGYLFQSAIVQHDALTQAAGPALGTMRIATVVEDEQVRSLYAVWKLPAPDAMSDNFWQDGSMLAEIALADGTVQQVRRGKGLDMEMVQAHPQTGMSLIGLQIPHWDAAIKLATQAHAHAIGNGVLGFDVAISQTGPIVVEGNTNPFHMLYQLATGRGILNDEFSPVFDRISKAQQLRLAA